MSRRSNRLHDWSLDPADPVAVPNARIALALIRCVRRLPGAFSEHNFDDLGNVLAPIVERLKSPLRTVLRAHFATAAYRARDAEEIDLLGTSLLQDRRIHLLLGEALARATPRFLVFFDTVEALLRDFVERHPHVVDANLATLAPLLELPEPEVRFLRLGAAFCYGSIDRGLFTFVNSSSRLIRALEVVCDVRGTHALRLFDADRPLARSGLLNALGGKRRSSDLDDMLALSAVGDRLLSVPFADAAEMAAAILTPFAPATGSTPLEWPHLATAQTLLRTGLHEALRIGARGFNVLLHGGPGTGKTEFARALVADLGATAFTIDHIDDAGGEATRGDRLASLRLSQTFAGHHDRCLLVLDEAEDIFDTDYQHPFAPIFRDPSQSKAWMNSLLEHNAHPVIWISNQVSQLDPAYLRRFAFCLEFPRTPYALRHRIADGRLRVAGCSRATVDAVASDERVTPALLAAAVRFSTLAAGSGLGADVAVRTHLDEHARASGILLPPASPPRTTRFDMRYLNVDGTATPERVVRALEGASSSSLLFSGPPGTGKTQFAAEIAQRLGRRLKVRTASDINAKWYGESERNVALMFRDCDPKEELLFLDEAEVLLGARTDTAHRADRAVTAEFLRWLEVFDGFFVCATNHASDFDAALMRRFTFRLQFKPLDAAQRQGLYVELALAHASSTDAPAPALAASDASRLARLDQLTPGDFANAARRIRMLGLDASAWIGELEAEHATKRAGPGTSIGFL